MKRKIKFYYITQIGIKYYFDVIVSGPETSPDNFKSIVINKMEKEGIFSPLAKNNQIAYLEKIIEDGEVSVFYYKAYHIYDKISPFLDPTEFKIEKVILSSKASKTIEGKTLKEIASKSKNLYEFEIALENEAYPYIVEVSAVDLKNDLDKIEKYLDEFVEWFRNHHLIKSQKYSGLPVSESALRVVLESNGSASVNINKELQEAEKEIKKLDGTVSYTISVSTAHGERTGTLEIKVRPQPENSQEIWDSFVEKLEQEYSKSGHDLRSDLIEIIAKELELQYESSASSNVEILKNLPLEHLVKLSVLYYPAIQQAYRSYLTKMAIIAPENFELKRMGNRDPFSIKELPTITIQIKKKYQGYPIGGTVNIAMPTATRHVRQAIRSATVQDEEGRRRTNLYGLNQALKMGGIGVSVTPVYTEYDAKDEEGEINKRFINDLNQAVIKIKELKKGIKEIDRSDREGIIKQLEIEIRTEELIKDLEGEFYYNFGEAIIENDIPYVFFYIAENPYVPKYYTFDSIVAKPSVNPDDIVNEGKDEIKRCVEDLVTVEQIVNQIISTIAQKEENGELGQDILDGIYEELSKKDKDDLLLAFLGTLPANSEIWDYFAKLSYGYFYINHLDELSIENFKFELVSGEAVTGEALEWLKKIRRLILNWLKSPNFYIAKDKIITSNYIIILAPMPLVSIENYEMNIRENTLTNEVIEKLKKAYDAVKGEIIKALSEIGGGLSFSDWLAKGEKRENNRMIMIALERGKKEAFKKVSHNVNNLTYGVLEEICERIRQIIHRHVHK